MKLRSFDAAGPDARALAGFVCSTGASFEDDVQDWIRADAIGWLNDIPKSGFQRRHLALVEDGSSLVGVTAWQDIIRVDLEGIWLEVLAVSTESQHGGLGQAVYDLVIDHLRTVDRDGDHLGGVVHVDNERSQRLLDRNGWQRVADWDTDHELWAGLL